MHEDMKELFKLIASNISHDGTSTWGSQLVLHLSYKGQKYRLSLEKKSPEALDYNLGEET